MDRPTDRRRFLALAGASVGASLAGCAGVLHDGERNGKIDDWQFDPEQVTERDGGRGVPGSATGGGLDGGGGGGGLDGGGATFDAAAETSAEAGGDDLGFSVGGAANVATFRRNVREGYLPQPESIQYEGLFYDYYFDTGSSNCSELFCPAYSPARSPDPLSGEPDEYLTVGLDSSLTESSFDRNPLNLVVVLDVSGSMGGGFSSYYYDRSGERREPEGETHRDKIEVAKDALVALTEQLRPEDRLGVVLYSSEAHVAKPLRKVEATDMDAIRRHVREDLVASGGTNTEAGIDRATELLGEYADADPTERENRTILLTDAQPNVGDTSAGGLRGTLEANAERNLYTSVVGIGLDFNTELVDRITSIRGANYSGVHSAEEFRRRLGERFEYLVSPLVFDLSLELDAPGYRIADVYGTTAGEETTGRLAHVNTLFPSPTEDGGTRGGVVLVELERTDDAAAREVSLEASWETRGGRERSTTERVAVPSATEQYDSTGVRKAVLLSRYATLLRNWIAHERGATSVEEAEGIETRSEPDALGQWEQQSVPLTVTAPYDERIATFREAFAAEAEAIGDPDLDRELELLDELLAAA